MKPDSKLLELHRSRKPEMIQVARDFANELQVLCDKYNKQCKSNYVFSIRSETDDSGIIFNESNSLRLLDLYYPDKGNPVINLNE